MLLRILTKPVVLLVIAVCLALAAVFLWYQADNFGAEIGAGTGKMTGLAVGSFKGISSGLEAGAVAGKEAGLNSDDMTLEISQIVREVGNLEVLVANVEIPDYHEVGKKYAALYLFRGSAVFSIDLSKASVSKTTDGEVIILLPEPTVVVNINDSETELLAEYQRKFFNGSADDGFQAYLNSLRLIDSIAVERVSNYEMLMNMARASAKKQVSMLAGNVCLNCSKITIVFRSES